MKLKILIWGIGLLFVANYFVWQVALAFSDDDFHIFFLNVGQGDAILLRTPDHRNILVDGGPDASVVGELSRVLPFWDRQIDLMVLTHPQADHVTGLLSVLERFPVTEILATFESYDTQTNQAWLDAAFNGEHAINYADASDDYYFGEVTWDTLYPLGPDLGSTDDINENSVIVRVSYQGHNLLLMGDAGFITEQELVDIYGNLDIGILKVGHHGSRYASSEDFLNNINPKVAIIQVGKNKFGHPTTETLERLEDVGAEVYRNDADGTIEMILNKTGYKIITR